MNKATLFEVLTLDYNSIHMRSLWYLENIDVQNIFCPNKTKNQVTTDHLTIVEKDDPIYLSDEKSEYIYFIMEGRIKIESISEEGKEITKAILSKGEVFGELSLIGEPTRRDQAIALELTKICKINSSEMKDLIRDHSNLSLFFMKIMGSKVIEMEKRLESLVFKDSRSRIVEYLTELVRKRGERIGYEWVVRNFITHQEIANLTATSRQTVTTVLNELRTGELITFNRKRLLVRDLEKLTAEIK